MGNIDRHERTIGALEEEVARLTTEVALLKLSFQVRSGVWGAIGGALPVLITMLLYLVFRK